MEKQDKRQYNPNRQMMPEERGYKEKIKNHRKKIRNIGLFGIGLVLIVIVVVVTITKNKKYSSYAVLKEYKIEDTVGGAYYRFGNYILKYNNDGISCLNGTKSVWNQAFEMQNAVIDICKDYVAIGEKHTNKIYIFNTKGQQGEVNTKYPLVDVSVAAQGVVAAVLEADDANYVQVMDTEGNELVTGRTVLSGDGYPIDLALSDDGKKLMVSYLKVNEERSETSIAFYNFSEVGKSEIDRLMAGFNQYKTTIVPKCEFLNNNTAVAIGDNMFTIYTMKEKPENVYEETFDLKIASVFYNESYVGFIFNNEDAKATQKIKVYNLKGSKVLEKDFSFVYTDVQFAGDDILLHNDSECMVISQKGVTKYKGTFSNGIIGMVPGDDHYSYYVIDVEGMKKIKLK